MLKLFQRRGKPEPAAERRARQPAPPRQQPAQAPAGAAQESGPAPLPEVVAEGNSHADWSVWEDSMTALDSQLPGMVPSARIHVREARPSQLDDLDPFSGVGRNRDV
jgi:hypothetical protein